MGRLFGRADAQERRSLVMPAIWDAARSTSFASVDASGEGAFRSVAVGSAMRLTCSLGSEMPTHVYRGWGQDRVEVRTSALDDPAGDGYGLEDWLYQGLMSYLFRGNVYGDILSFDSRTGRMNQLRWYHPDEVRLSQIDPVTGVGKWTVNGRPVTNTARFFHRRAFPVPGRIVGPSPIEQHMTQPQVSIAASLYGAQWFADGAHPTSMLTNSESDLNGAVDLPDGSKTTQAAIAKKRFMSILFGKREPLILGKGWDWKQIQISPNESQFLDTMRYSEAQCARIFGPAMAETLGYETGGSMTYANVVDRRSDLLTYSLNPWLRRMERILTAMLPNPQYVRFDRDALLESTTLARYEAHAKALQNKWKTPNEVRDDEDMAPVPWGDEPISGPATAPAAPAGGN